MPHLKLGDVLTFVYPDNSCDDAKLDTSIVLMLKHMDPTILEKTKIRIKKNGIMVTVGTIIRLLNSSLPVIGPNHYGMQTNQNDSENVFREITSTFTRFVDTLAHNDDASRCINSSWDIQDWEIYHPAELLLNELLTEMTEEEISYLNEGSAIYGRIEYISEPKPNQNYARWYKIDIYASYNVGNIGRDLWVKQERDVPSHEDVCNHLNRHIRVIGEITGMQFMHSPKFIKYAGMPLIER